MPLRTAYKLCPHAIFVDGHPDRYRDVSARVLEVLQRFTPKVEMASIDEAYLDMSGTERLHGPALRAARSLHDTMKLETQLNCSVGVGTSRLVAKICSDLAKPNGMLFVVPGCEAHFLAPLAVRKMPGIGKVTEQSLADLDIHKIADLAALDESFLEERFGKCGLAMAGKARGEDAGGWFDEEIGEGSGPKSIGHEHTFNEDVSDGAALEAMLARLAEMVGRRLREHKLHARTLHLKLRYSDFTTLTRAITIEPATQIDVVIFEHARDLFRQNWRPGATVRLLGIRASSLETVEGQLDLLDGAAHDRWKHALAAADKLREKFGDGAISLASSMKARFRERTHENPADLPGKK
jgi:DNA polymerase-4